MTSLNASLLHTSSGLRRLALLTVSLPLFGFIGCVAYTFLYHFEASTTTHCAVPNFAPSISVSIGHPPQKFAWQFCVALHIHPRFWFGYLACRQAAARAVPSKVSRVLSGVALLSQWAENAFLLLLTVVSSEENFPVHQFAFTWFCISALVHQVILVYLSRGYQPRTVLEARSVRYKRLLLRATFVCGLLMTYFYYRHVTHCEPYMYSFFCVAEYVVVLCNMGFHMTAYYDLHHAEVTVRNTAKSGSTITTCGSPEICI